MNGNGGPSNKIRRIIPTKVGEVASKSTTGSSLEAQAAISRTELKSSENLISTETKPIHLDDKDQAEKVETEECSDMMEEVAENKEEPQAGPSTSTTKVAKNILTPQLEQLIKASRTAEASIDMKLVIKNKLLKYYHMVHPDFVTSKTFLKSLKATTDEIVRAPHLVYASLKVIIDELDARRKCKATIFTTEESLEVEGTGDEAKDARLKILYKALVKCKRTITDLEEAEVDWEDDDNSSYLKKVRFEKRACEIYHKVSWNLLSACQCFICNLFFRSVRSPASQHMLIESLKSQSHSKEMNFQNSTSSFRRWSTRKTNFPTFGTFLAFSIIAIRSTISA